MIAVLLLGCSGSHSDKPKEKPPDKQEPKSSVPSFVQTNTGEATYKGKDNEKLWTIHWEQGSFSMPKPGNKKESSGSMIGVFGDIFREGKVTCKFKANKGSAFESSTTKRLTLTDHVRLDAQNPAVTLLCDELVYDGIKKFYKAKGHVQILGTVGSKGTLEEVWANADLTKLASPELYDKP